MLRNGIFSKIIISLIVISLILTTQAQMAQTVVSANESPPNGYRGDKPLTVFYHDTITGDLVYTVGNSYYSSKLFPDSTYEVSSPITLPAGTTVTFARLYTYWTWSAIGSTGRYPDLKLTFDGDQLSPDVKYDDRKGYSDYYDYPSGTWAYNVTDYVTGAGNHTTVIENTGPQDSYFAVSGVGLLVIYTEPDGDEIEYWIAEGCDLISSQNVSGLTPEEATTEAVFSGPVNPINVEDAKLTTVVQSGNNLDNMLIFNTQNWTGIYDGTPYADLDVDQQDVRNYLVRTDNTVKIRAVGDYMAPSNAFLVLRNASSDGPPALPTLPTPAPADGSTVSLAATIKPAISIEITPSSYPFQKSG